MISVYLILNFVYKSFTRQQYFPMRLQYIPMHRPPRDYEDYCSHYKPPKNVDNGMFPLYKASAGWQNKALTNG